MFPASKHTMVQVNDAVLASSMVYFEVARGNFAQQVSR
ncbi:hypothetical protein HMPREF1109_0237 [Streptococcus intermedius SK54 = ATCC 27335]|nr:hypothetical protein HMPREF1109_0237 [Streptococcus intermedius SK54 = ATCC 27335]